MSRSQELQREKKERIFVMQIKEETEKLGLGDKKSKAVRELVLWAYRRGVRSADGNKRNTMG